ncbi:hypothetical protein HanPI659440_Chr17g0687141 [Helianthus annuus]|nr:hypothetical protein HanPI659440_Chr17g0687141 [Helianthus annuus]
MASEQLIRRNKNNNNKAHDQVEQGQVPQVAHFESLTVMQEPGGQPGSAAVVHRVEETMYGTAGGGIHDQSRTQRYDTQGQRQQKGAQQQSSDQARKNNYGATQTKADHKGALQAGDQSKKNNYGATQRSQYTAENTSGFTDVGKRGAVAGKNIAMETGQTAAEFAGKAAGVATDAAVTGTNIAMATGKTAAELAGKAAGVAADAAVTGTNIAMATGRTAAELATGAAVTGTNIALETGKTAAGLAGKAAGVAVDTAVTGTNIAVETGKTAAELAGKAAGVAVDAAVTSKDVAVGTGRTAGKFAGKAAGVAGDAALVAGWSAAEFASDTKEGVKESMENLNYGVARAVDGTAVAAETAAEKALGVAETAVDAGKKGAGYVGQTMVRGKDVTLQTGKTTAGYVGKAAESAAEFASDTSAGVRETVESVNYGVGGVIAGAAVAAEKVGGTVLGVAGAVVDIGKKGAGYIGGATKDATLVAGRSAAELASGAAAGVTESMENINYGVGGLVEGTALATENVARKTLNTVVDVGKKGVDVGKKGAGYIGEKAVAGKDITLESGKAGAGVVKDAALVGGWSALELASDTTEGLSESMEDVNAGVAGFVENAAVATEVAAGKATGLKDTAVDAGKEGANIALETGKKGAGIALETGKTTAGYVGRAADAARASGRAEGARGATEFASDTNAGAKPKGIVMEREKITIDSAQRGKTEKETKRVYNEGYRQ